jgi:hypothetical protein
MKRIFYYAFLTILLPLQSFEIALPPLSITAVLLAENPLPVGIENNSISADLSFTVFHDRSGNLIIRYTLTDIAPIP